MKKLILLTIFLGACSGFNDLTLEEINQQRQYNPFREIEVLPNGMIKWEVDGVETEGVILEETQGELQEEAEEINSIIEANIPRAYPF